VGKEGAKFDPEVARAAPQRHPVIRNAHVVADQAGDERAKVSKETEDAGLSPETRGQSAWEQEREEHSGGQPLH
jgi:hypothetical protein